MFTKYFTQWKYRISIIRTIWFNVHFFPLRIALKFPVLVARHVVFRCMKGRVLLTAPIRPGMVRIGFRDMGIQDERNQRTVLDIRAGSSIIFEGSAIFGGGGKLYTKGDLIIGNDFYLSLNSQLIAHDKIQFGPHCTVGWDVLIMDTDFHRVINSETKEAYPMTKPIVIGEHCWICNGVQIQKGTVLAHDCIVGAMSLCNKVYDTPYSLIAGIPAKLKKTNISHVR